MKKRINVTQRDIDEGIAYEPIKCPVARAIKRHILRDQLTEVTPSRVVFRKILRAQSTDLSSGEVLVHFPKGSTILVPQVATRFIRAFDQGKPVEPFTFTLDLPDEVLR